MVEASDTKKKTKWVSELEIGIVAKVFAVPKKYEDGLNVSEQEQQLREGFAELIATKMVLLTKTDAADFVPLPLEPPADNPLLLLAARSYENRDFIRRTLNPIQLWSRWCLIHGCGVAGAKGDQAGRRGCPRIGARNGFGGEGCG